MTNLAPVEILIVKDNADDAELALHGLRKFHLRNDVRVVTDGDEALDYLYELRTHLWGRQRLLTGSVPEAA